MLDMTGDGAGDVSDLPDLDLEIFDTVDNMVEGLPLKTHVIVQYGKAWKGAKDKWWIGSGLS